MANQLGIDFTQKIDTDHVEYVASEAERIAKEKESDYMEDFDKIKMPKLFTNKWNIPPEETYNAPVGFARNKAQPLESLGNEELVKFLSSHSINKFRLFQ